jgi:hypothetical protein
MNVFEIEEQARRLVWYQIADLICCQVSEQVRQQVRKQIYGSSWYLVWEQFRSPVCEQAKEDTSGSNSSFRD